MSAPVLLKFIKQVEEKSLKFPKYGILNLLIVITIINHIRLSDNIDSWVRHHAKGYKTGRIFQAYTNLFLFTIRASVFFSRLVG